MKKNSTLIAAGLVFLASLVISCSTRRVKKDMTPTEAMEQKIADGRQVFKIHCQKCHPNGEAGVGPAINDKKFPGFILRARIRTRAIFLWTGRMPSFDKHEISNVELDALIAYLKDMQKKDK